MSPDRKCPLPIIRPWWGPNDELIEHVDGGHLHNVEVCGEDLVVVSSAYGDLLEDGSSALNLAGDDWQVRCHNGHVLVTSTDEGCELRMPYRASEILEALEQLDVLVEGSILVALPHRDPFGTCPACGPDSTMPDHLRGMGVEG